MFFNLHPDVIKRMNEQNRNIPSFNDYFNKRYLEECKYFVENPKFSFKYMLFVSHLKENIKKMALKEYKEKYPGAPILDSNLPIKTQRSSSLSSSSHQLPPSTSLSPPPPPPSSPSLLTNSNNNSENLKLNIDKIEDDYDIINNINENTNEPQIRRSKRLQNKN